jgi:hypothetical protein
MRLLALLGLLAAGCSSGPSTRPRTLPDGFLVDDNDLGVTRDLAASAAADFGGRDLAPAPGADLLGSIVRDLAVGGPDGALTGVATPDTCAQAYLLTSGVELVDQDTTGLGDEITFGNTASTACVDVSGTLYAAPDAIYKITVPAGKTLTVTVTGQNLPTRWDPAVAIVTDCMLAGPTCVAARDEPSFTAPEVVSWTNTGADQLVYIIVDSALSMGGATFDNQGRFDILASIS